MQTFDSTSSEGRHQIVKAYRSAVMSSPERLSFKCFCDNNGIFYSLACSCRLHKINFFEYLSDILNRADVLQRTASPETYRDILPDRWKKNEQGLCITLSFYMKLTSEIILHLTLVLQFEQFQQNTHRYHLLRYGNI